MIKPRVEINLAKCILCKSCVEVCPNQIFGFENNTITVRVQRSNLCFACGHCVAVCKNNAVQVEGLDYTRDFFEMDEPIDFSSHFEKLIQSRRSVRAFKNKPVPKELLEDIVKAISFSPPSFPPIKTELVVITNCKIIEEALPLMVGLYDKMVKGLENPIVKRLIKRKMGAEKYRVVQNHLLPLLKVKLPYMKNGTEDAITRNAQSIILFHTAHDAENSVADVYIAVGFALLKAHSIGLGATVVDLIGPSVERVPELREMFKIPPKNKVITSIILGYPKYHFSKGIKRELKSVVYI